MNKAFDAFLSLPDQERRDVFNAAAERLDTLATYIEKDFWVCLVLNALYHDLPDNHPRLLFKGGTSLSKAFGAIHRFSEDIDVVVFRDDLGFTGDRDPTVWRTTDDLQAQILLMARCWYLIPWTLTYCQTPIPRMPVTASRSIPWRVAMT